MATEVLQLLTAVLVTTATVCTYAPAALHVGHRSIQSSTTASALLVTVCVMSTVTTA
jgi:hypothetical protein